MDFKKLFMNNKAVSPVIGVILMVAITVILAAAIGSTVFGEGTATPAPQASLAVKPVSSYNSATTPATPATVKIEHLGGDEVSLSKSSTKIMVSLNNTNSQQRYMVPSDGDYTLGVGDIKSFKIVESVADDGSVVIDQNIKPGSTLNIKLIDLTSGQIYFDRDVAF